MRRRISHRDKLLIGVLGVFVGTSTRAATITARENPYAKAIVNRNAFSLNAPLPTIVVPPRPPLPRITLQGVTTINGRRQVLFKVQFPSKAGEPAREISCVLSEGERMGEIKVLEIDQRAGTVKFNNHGSEQTLNLWKAETTTAESRG